MVLPVYNGAEHLAESMESILAQRLQEFELLIVNDASADGSLAIALAYQDSRIRVIDLEHNIGLAAALNIGIEAASTPIVARQDQDDISDPRRLERQLAAFDLNPGLVLVGTWARIISQSADGDWTASGSHRHPVADDELRLRLLWNNPFVHSSVAFRRDVFVQAGRYGTDPILSWPEDYDLWVRMAPLGELANIPEELLTYRQTAGGMSDAHRDRIRDGVVRIASANLAMASGIEIDNPDLLGLARVLNSVPAKSVSPLQVWRRVRIFQRAAAKVAPGGALHLLAVRARWASKIAIRSLDPRWGTLDER
ncbi:MAG: glycosyltransferase [Actinomycetota bacterium]|nr:glycosyltransferase [Actinomycetota bacterium]